jgi:hypothetical protein
VTTPFTISTTGPECRQPPAEAMAMAKQHATITRPASRAACRTLAESPAADASLTG